MTLTNRRVVLRSRPTASATPVHFEMQIQELGSLEPGMVRVGVEYLSVDAGTRTMLVGEGFHHQVRLGEVVRAGGVGRIVETADDRWAVGQAVRGPMGAQTVATVAANSLAEVDDSVESLSVHLGALGMSTGVTAWVGVRQIAKPKPGETFVVSAAAGAVGSIAGQIAKLDGARVIGIAGGAHKVSYLVDTLGFDAAIDYKSEDVSARLKELAPDGLNVFYDNVGGPVGGPILDAALDNLAMRAMVVICGAISQYDSMDNVKGPSLYLRLAERQSTMEGFAYFHFPECFDDAASDLTAWLADGSLVAPEHVLEGIDQFPHALEFMYQGGNLGKLLVKVG